MSSSPPISIYQAWQPINKQTRSLPELLALRQATGRASRSRVGTLAQRGVPQDLISARSAWNSKRLQNMILAVGPGTPASLWIGSGPDSSSSCDSSSTTSDGHDDDDSSSDSAHDEPDAYAEESPSGEGRSRWVSQQEEEEDEEMRINVVEDVIRSYLNDGEEWESSEEANDDRVSNGHTDIMTSPSIRHGGCVNTAAWLDCGWKISSPGRNAVVSEECPTQLVTSGDDLCVKFWDVSQAMGMNSPLAGGSDTLCPYSAPEPLLDVNELRSKWQRYYEGTNSKLPAGTVIPLATINTGHMNNVFHATPLRGQPGKVATCAADGFLRLADLHSDHSTVVISPEYDDRSELMFRPAMCFSHHFLSQNTGLLCSERGLRRFDLRLPPREQSTRSLLVGSVKGCKACAVWSASKSSTSLDEGDSAYVFAGGSSPTVSLWDLRMTDPSSNKVVQNYCPRNLEGASTVSVSGIDVSRDGQELLLSYESDQIYTFPVFPSSCSANPTADEIENLAKGTPKVLPELACYGAHLNRFTFLKNAKYAGPRDEYICTGSDSGHAWIYEKKNGSVVSLLNADHSTCNGVIPHPSLPFFITYGIDSTAKLWRATNPVDSIVSDTEMGRQHCDQKRPYRISPIVSDWDSVQKFSRRLDLDEVKDAIDYLMPDQIPAKKDMVRRGRCEGFHLSRGVKRLGNDLHNLPQVLESNFFESVQGIVQDDIPVESGAKALKHRISLIRLRHQAGRLGLPWNQSLPWQFEVPQDGESAFTTKIHPAELVPDSPSDWIPYDPEMTAVQWDFDEYFNTKDYQDFHSCHYSFLACDDPYPYPASPSKDSGHDTMSSVLGESMPDTRNNIIMEEDSKVQEVKTTGKESIPTPDRVQNILVETTTLLKDAGNLALQEGEFDLAAKRYDKALRYASVACMSFPTKSLEFASGREEFFSDSGGFHFLTWDQLTKLVVRTRLNLALLFLKPHFSMHEEAIAQSQKALHDLAPFCCKKGNIMKGKKLTRVHKEGEPDETYIDAKALEAKAYFRLGSAQYELDDYAEAILSYEKSVQSTEATNANPDNLVLRRLSEAKRESRRARKRERKKFEFGFSRIVSPDSKKSGREAPSDSNIT